MRKIILADNDIIHELACCGLLQELLEWLDAPPAEVWVLPSMQFMLRKKLKDNKAALRELTRFLEKVSNIPEANLTTLQRFQQMDTGEAQMMAILLDRPEVQRMITGDKRALKLVGSLCVQDAELKARLATARVDCLESVMLGLIDKLGFDIINQRATQGIMSDKVLQSSFGAKKLEPNAKEALEYYLTDIRKEAPFLP